MDTITLQIKRVTDNWETHKAYVPAQGEPVLIDVSHKYTDVPRRLVIGTGTLSLEALYNVASARSFATVQESCGYTDEQLETKLNEVTPTSPNVPGEIDVEAETSDVGTSSLFARSDHSHKVNLESLVSALTSDTFGYHKIGVGTSLPSDDEGEDGDIFILYKE